MFSIQALEREALERDLLPNGFHDSVMRHLAVDWAQRRIVVDIDAEISDPDAYHEPVYRRVRLTLEDVALFVMDPPGPRADETFPHDSWIDLGDGQPPTSPAPSIAPPAGCSLIWIWVHQLNAFFRIAGRSASLTAL